MNPFQLFEAWFTEEKSISNLKLPAACCLSSFGLNGYPNSRFVSLKEVAEDVFYITGSLDSRKGMEILENPKVALLFWWATTERQVRIQGDVEIITDSKAEKYFSQRSRDSQIVSSIFKQGKEIDSIDKIKSNFEKEKSILQGKAVKRPSNWSGFAIMPSIIEFMDFKDNRLHERQIYIKQENSWKFSILQP